MSKEKEWDKCFMDAALIFASMSHCAAKKVACILVKNNAIISIGVNGTLTGLPNCNEIFKKIDNKWYRNIDNQFTLCDNQEEHFIWSKKNEVHAEINALAKAGVSGISTKDSTAYITYSPCNNCALALASFGIKRVVYKKVYDAEQEGIKLLENFGVEVNILE